jgi:diphthine-ammonia ligase
MRVAAFWSGGKDCYTAYHNAIEQGHHVVYLLTCVYLEPYIFHSLLMSELGAKALGTPQIKFKVKDYKNMYQAWFEVFARLKKEGIEAIVTGDIDSVDHKRAWDDMCSKFGMELIMPLWDLPSYPGNRYRERVLNMELSTGMKAIINCIDLKYFGEEWLGREFDRACVQEMKALVGPPGVGIDATGEFGDFHTTVLDSPLFKESIEITKFSKKKLVWGGPGLGDAQTHMGLPSSGNFLYMDIEEAVLRPKNR